MTKGIYLPTNQNTIILSEVKEYCEILLDGEYKTVPKDDISLQDDSIDISTLSDLKKSIFLNCISGLVG
ncbi:MAG: hypothetical protein FAF03_07065 [Epsilonproteobacteria bacterium]|nr:hypothetical protein [Campylobacterota bacterium]